MEESKDNKEYCIKIEYLSPSGMLQHTAFGSGFYTSKEEAGK